MTVISLHLDTAANIVILKSDSISTAMIALNDHWERMCDASTIAAVALVS